MRIRQMAASAVLSGALVSIGGAAMAQSYPGGEVPPQNPQGGVLGVDETVERPRGAEAAVEGVQFAVTGGDVVGLSLIGAGLVGGGIVLVKRSRRTEAQPA